MLAISLPRVVGVAGWPWVRLIMGTAAWVCAMSRSLVVMRSRAGRRTLSRASRSIRAWARLLMSSLVQAKWMYSLAAAISAFSAKCCLSQYSTALTSWLVVASICLMAAASSWLKVVTVCSMAARVLALNGGTSPMSGAAARLFSHSSSTVTRAFIRPYSEWMGRRAATALA